MFTYDEICVYILLTTFFISNKLQFTCACRCTMDPNCEAYKYNVTDFFLNRTSSAARTLFSDEDTSLFMKGEIMSD